jgi:hypothetical protein
MGLTHHVAIAVVNENRFQAMCNPIKCGWVGSVTTQRQTAEFEREIHYIEILALDTQHDPQ